MIADTHGLLRPEVLTLAREADAVLHAGDMGSPEVLDALRAATPDPVYAVRGNVDRTPPLAHLPETLLLTLEGVWVYLLHNLQRLDLSPHAPRLEEREGVTRLNPGAAGPRRFRLPVACAQLYLSPSEVRAQSLTLLP